MAIQVRIDAKRHPEGSSSSKQRFLEIDDLIARSEQVGNELQTRIESLQFLAPYRR